MISGNIEEEFRFQPIRYVDSVECSVMLNWSPNPERIVCVRRCLQVKFEHARSLM